jgi:hypothetical protein
MSGIKYVKVIEDSAFSLMARVVGSNGVLITQADITSIAYSVVKISDGTVIGTGSLTVADVVFDTLQTDKRWSEDSTGYNVLITPNPTLIPEGGVTYAFEVVFTPVVGYPFIVIFHIETIPAYGS